MNESSFNIFLSDGKNGFSEGEGITVLSLFDGMSCGQLALKKLGIKVKQYYAAEIDKHAIQVTQHNFPNTIQLGDVTKVFAKDLPKIDLLFGGSPCQGFSFAGKQLAFDDPRSKLFFEFVRLKNECNPTYFMLENVKMKKEFELIQLLASKPGKVFTRQEIFNKIWGMDVIVGDRTIDVHIRKIREKIGEDFIKTIKGIGYKFDH